MRLIKCVLFTAAVLATTAAPGADLPGQRFSISPASLAKPYATAAVANDSKAIARPTGALPKVPDGFAVSVFAGDVPHARWMTVAPNGDVFLAQSDLGKVVVLRPSSDGAHAAKVRTFASGFDRPHGLAIHNGALYVADVKSLWRLPYAVGALSASGRRVHIADTTPAEGPGHFTRDIVFDSKGTLYLAIGSRDNVGEDPLPYASVQVVNANGTLSTFASGLRNPVGIAFYPGTDDLYVTVNERDGLGDDLPPDYLTRIRKGDFFGWPYAYTGSHADPDNGKKRPDLVAKTKTPDVLFHAHSAPLGLVFYDGNQFPAEYRGNAFVALHGSWNDAHPTGYKIVRVKITNGRPENAYENFLTGFWDGASSPARVWGRPVGLVIAKDGSLLVADDVGGTVWRVAYRGK
ncbi:MAG TPA: PQQ-dependent sugar dehydrogenase [Rhizomicrobium sp.]|jgi:glucose/arabinose dehydrogenase|nr:PQQ-dependent sugar dehydrogenase [Rhizomicrobium sp.]